MNVTINGSHHVLPADASIPDALAACSVVPDQSGIAIALNGRVILRSAWQTTPLNEGDEVEVVTAAQGG